MNSARVTILLICLIGLQSCLAHICILHPHQRGQLSVAVPGDDSCYRRTSYCGGVPSGPITAKFVAGEHFTLKMQLNLNHYNPAKPGYYEILLSYEEEPTEDSWVVLSRWDDWPANDMVIQVNVTREIHIPAEKTCDKCVLGARYVSYNQYEIDPKNNTDAIFYNCADVQIVTGNNDEAEPAVMVEQHALAVTPKSCCAPRQWEGEAISFNELGELKHRIFYDADKMLVRWDREGALEGHPENEELTTITFYNSGPPFLEYLIDFKSNTCVKYGADAFYEWCFGEDRSMKYTGNYTVDKVVYDQWMNPSNQFYFTASQYGNECIPDSVHHQDYTFTFKDVQPKISNPAIFNLPPFCNNAPIRSGCGGL